MMHGDSSDEEEFLLRWSQRKQVSQEIAPETESAGELAAAPEEGVSLPGDEEMPAIESLTEDSDFTGFLSPRVSEGLRRLALRKLFHSAEFNVCDGLDDYAEDFTHFAKLGSIITSDMLHQLDVADKKLSQPQGSAGTSSPVDLQDAQDQGLEKKDPDTLEQDARAEGAADDADTLSAPQDDEPVEDEIAQ